MRVNQDNKSVDIEVRDFNGIFPHYIATYLFYSRNEEPEKIIIPLVPDVPHPVDPRKRVPIEYVPMDDPRIVELVQDGSNVAEATEEQVAEIDKKEDELLALKARIAELENTSQSIADEAADLQLEVDTETIDGLTAEEQDREAMIADLAPAPEDLLRQQEENEPEIKGTPESKVFIDSREPESIKSAAAKAFGKVEIIGETKTEGDITSVQPVTPDRIPKQPEHPAPEGSQLDGMHARGRSDQKTVARDLREEPELPDDGAVETEIDKSAVEE